MRLVSASGGQLRRLLARILPHRLICREVAGGELASGGNVDIGDVSRAGKSVFFHIHHIAKAVAGGDICTRIADEQVAAVAAAAVAVEHAAGVGGADDEMRIGVSHQTAHLRVVARAINAG